MKKILIIITIFIILFATIIICKTSNNNQRENKIAEEYVNYVILSELNSIVTSSGFEVKWDVVEFNKTLLPKLLIKSELPESGTIVIDENGINYMNFCVHKTNYEYKEKKLSKLKNNNCR